MDKTLLQSSSAVFTFVYGRAWQEASRYNDKTRGATSDRCEEAL
jgi:hypothetical protein